MNKQPEQTAKTRQRLTEAFWTLYCQKPIAKITVREITELAGYNRGTFYVYFRDVYDVLEQLEDGLLPKIDNQMPLELHSFSAERLLQDFLSFYEQNGRYLSVLLSEKGDPTFPARMKAKIKASFYETNLLPSDDPRIDYALEYVSCAGIGTITYWFNSEKKLPLEELIKLLHALLTESTFSKMAQIIRNSRQEA